MYDYIRNELPNLVMHHFPATARKSISGHSMGGLGALVLALRNPDEYVSVSAFSPIVSPIASTVGTASLLPHILVKIKMPGWITTR